MHACAYRCACLCLCLHLCLRLSLCACLWMCTCVYKCVSRDYKPTLHHAAFATALRRTGNAAVYIYAYACVYVCIYVCMHELLLQLRCIALVPQLSVHLSIFFCKRVSTYVYMSCPCNCAASYWRCSCLHICLCFVCIYVSTYAYISCSYVCAASPFRHGYSPLPVAAVY